MNFNQLEELLELFDPVFAIFQLAWPILMLCLALCLYLVAKSNNASQHIEPSQRRHAPGVAEDSASFKHDSRKPKPWFCTNMALGIAFCVPLTAGAMGTIGGVKDFFPGHQPPAGYKSPDSIKFEKIINSADTHLANGEEAKAKALYMDALNLKQIPLINAAEPMNGVAKVLIDEGRFDAAEPMAYVAARLHSQDPVYVNSYVTILIEKCRLPEAVEILKGLDLDQNFDSRRLEELAEAKTDACSSASSDQ